VFPDSEHRFCVRHLYANFNEKFKGEILKKIILGMCKVFFSSTMDQKHGKDESFESGCLQMAREDAS